MSAQRVARAFSLYYAGLFVREDDEAATDAQVAAFAKHLKVSCSSPKADQYPCSVVVPGRAPQPCAAQVSSAGAVTGRCGDDDRAAPVATSGYVNCSALGNAISVNDPEGDEQRVVPGLRSDQLVPGSDPDADLLEVRVAMTATEFCVDWETRQPLSRGTWLGLYISHDGRSDTDFDPTINDSDGGGPQPQSPIDTPISGRVGTLGNWSSLVISRDAARTLPSAPFQLQAYANHEVIRVGHTRLTTDRAPNASTTYP